MTCLLFFSTFIINSTYFIEQRLPEDADADAGVWALAAAELFDCVFPFDACVAKGSIIEKETGTIAAYESWVEDTLKFAESRHQEVSKFNAPGIRTGM